MNFDWNDLKLFLAAAEAGSFTAAARAAKVSQPTLGRRIDALETSLGVTLFDRGPRGLTLTAGGEDLLAHARGVEAAAAKVSLSAAGRAQTLEGTVRITAPRLVCAHHMPAILTRLLDVEPGIEVELDASDAAGDLSLRQADIAVRMFRPTQSDLIAKRVATIGMGLYASRDYIADFGRPSSLAGIAEHRLVGYDADRRIVDWMAARGAAPGRSAFRLRIDDQIAYWPMVVAGAGVGVCQRMIGDAEPKVARVLEDLDLPELPVWLTTHSELRTSALIRRVYDFLADALGALR